MATKACFVQRLESQQEEDNAVYAKKPWVSFITSSRGGYIHGRVLSADGGRLFAVDVGASQTAEERELESVESFS
jgi:hypothetical protein